jgi:hypothetical protein
LTAFQLLLVVIVEARIVVVKVKPTGQARRGSPGDCVSVHESTLQK